MTRKRMVKAEAEQAELTATMAAAAETLETKRLKGNGLKSEGNTEKNEEGRRQKADVKAEKPATSAEAADHVPVDKGRRLSGILAIADYVRRSERTVFNWMVRDVTFAACLRLVGGVWEADSADLDAWAKMRAEEELERKRQEDASLRERIGRSRRMW